MMEFITTLLSPFNLLFFIIIAGFALGKIRIGKVSLGIAGILFAAILVGFLMNLLETQANIEIIANTQGTMKTFSRLGTSLFVAVIGLQTGFSIKNNSKTSLTAFFIGAVMSIAGVMITLLISPLDKAINYSSLLGILCGALTSTPGLSSVGELIASGNEDAILGYGCSYLLGAVLVVFFAQLFSKNTKIKEANKSKNTSTQSKIYPEMILISTSALLGGILGSLRIPLLNISLGNTASTLFIGLILGCIVQKMFISVSISPTVLNSFRNLGLALFFTGTGFSTGVQSVNFNIKYVLYGALITLGAILIGWLLCKLFSAKYSLYNGFIIAGGMTSSPAYGSLSSQSNESAINHFSFSYFGGLLSLIICIQIICR